MPGGRAGHGCEADESETGFTLVELMVVVLIIGLLMAIAIPTFLSLTGSAKTNGAEANLTVAAQDEAIYSTRYGSYDGTSAASPSAADNISATTTPGGVAVIDRSLNWTTTALTAGTAGSKVVYVKMISATELILGTAGQNGAFYWIDDNNGTASYDYNSSATAPSAPTSSAPWGTSWKAVTNL